MGKSAGPPPSYQQAAEQQAASSAANVNAQTLANRPNIDTPFASQAWQQGPDGTWRMSNNFSGGLGDAAQSLTQQAGQSLRPLDAGLFGPAQTGDAARQQAIDAAMGAATLRLNPMWQQREDATRSRLLAQGLDENSQAFRSAMENLGAERNDAYNQAMYSAIGQGTAAGDSTFRNNMAAQQATLANALRLRSQPLMDIQQLQGLLGMPGFQGAGMAESTQYLPAASMLGNYNLAQADMNNQLMGAGLGALGGLFGGAASLGKAISDERLKTKVHRHEAEVLPGVPVATWEWPWQPGVRHMGVIAQDLEAVAPEYVHTDEATGIKMVDYSFLEDGQ